MMSPSGQAGSGAQRPIDQGLYEQCSKTAYQVAIAVLGSAADAEDIAQDACLAVFSDLQSGKSISDIRKYASTIAYHRALKTKKRAARWAELSEDHLVDDQTGAVLANLSLAAQAVASLTTAQRLALCLQVGQGMSGQEVGELLGVNPQAAYKLAIRGRDKAQERYAELAGTRAGMPAECVPRARQIWALMSGKLGEREAAEIREHLATCSYCSTTRSEIGRGVAAILPLLPGAAKRRTDTSDRLVAARRGEEQLRRWPQAIAIALALLIVGVLGSMPLLIHRVPFKSAGAQPVPASAVAALATPLPSPTPPILRPGSFAYISRGEVFYATAVGDSPMQVTHTGGHVDAIYWSPDGRSLVYKQTAGGTLTGDLRQIDLKGQESWSLNVGAAAFAFAPDGSAYVAAVPNISGSTVSGYRLLIGTPGSQPAAGREIELAVSRMGSPITSASLGEASPLIWAEMPGGVGLRWTSAGIHLQCMPNCGYDIDPNSRAVRSNPDTDAFDPARAYVGPPNSVIKLAPPTVSVNGRPVAIPGAASIVLLAVSPDGQLGLANYARYDGGHDIAVVRADRSVAQLTSDGQSALGLFQPEPSG